MSQFIEQLESRQYMSVSLSGSTYVDVKAAETVITDKVNNGDKTDTYMIRIMKAGQVNIRLEGLTGDASLELITDRNLNNRQDSGEVTQKSNKLFAADESISRFVGVGIYYIRVAQCESNSLINYTLRCSTAALTSPDKVDTAGNTTADARDLSVPKGSNRTVNEYVSTEDTDMYRLNVTETSKFDIRLSGIVHKDCDMVLTDSTGKVLATTVGKAKNAKLIAGKLSAGTYYVTVSTVNLNTGYALRVNSGNYRSSDIDLTLGQVSKVQATKAVFSTKLIESK